VVHRIRILESNAAGYWDFFGFVLDIVSSSTGSWTGLRNKTNCDHRKNLKWINSFMKKKYTISKWYWLKCIFYILSVQCCRSASYLSGWGKVHLTFEATCTVVQFGTVWNWKWSYCFLWRSPSLFRRILFHLWNAFACRS